MTELKGKIHSLETCGTVDGPGIRFVVFMQGCALRCKYCHNPETWDSIGESEELTPNELLSKILKYRNYFGANGGVTFSGGEPLLQPDFLIECLKLCKENNIHTCIDTAGVGLGEYDEILSYTDLVILDIKAVDSVEYKYITGRDDYTYKAFLDACIKLNKKLWLRQVIVPTINDTANHIIAFREFAKSIPNVEKIELLPYKTMGITKYKSLNIPYPLDNIPELDKSKLKELNKYLKESN